MSPIKHLSSAQIRRTFLDYFGLRPSNLINLDSTRTINQYDHKIVPSVSLLPPLNDSSLVFVNAGMNAWKDYIQGKTPTSRLPSLMMANSQKCVRFSDIELVGHDGYHNTFFEMLGSWSFDGAYSKKDACRIAWDFLTGPMSLDKTKLFVTYFSGSHEHQPDNETKEIWKSIGVKDSHIIGFGSKENFWEMGATGPCGPSTEIHYDHKGRGASGVNQGFEDLVELWNLVFMEVERNPDGSLTPLPNKVIDTGMGLERLCAIKNDSISNFNTDLFMPIFEGITKETGLPEYKGKFKYVKAKKKRQISNKFSCIDTAYRIVGDHTRMISACLSDGFLPDTNHRLKHTIRKTLEILGNNFTSGDDKMLREKLLINLCKINSDILGSQYPEICNNFDRIKMVIEYENELLIKRAETSSKAFNKLSSQCPALASMIDPLDASQFQDALKVLKSADVTDGVISGDLAYKLYDTTGLNPADIAILAEAKALKFHNKAFDESFAKAKSNSKLVNALQRQKNEQLENLKGLSPTEDHYKYTYERKTESHYVFPMLTAKILDIIDIDSNASEAVMPNDTTTRSKKVEGDRCGIILDKTTFYSEAGGQVGDKGTLLGPNGATFVVEDCQKLEENNLILHIGHVSKGFFETDGDVKVKIDTNHRIGCMQNHTATHLLNYVLHSALPLTYQHSSRVDSEGFRFDFSAYNVDINTQFVGDIEVEVNSLIGQKTDVYRNTISAHDINDFMTRVPTKYDEIKQPHETQLVPWWHVDNDEQSDLSKTREDISTQTGSEEIDNVDSEAWIAKSRFISIPGQSYPDKINVITTPGGGVEPCCGTHVLNVGDVQSFVVLGCKSAGKGSIKSLRCVTGNQAIEARNNGLSLLADLSDITDDLEELEDQGKGSKIAVATGPHGASSDDVANPKALLNRVKSVRSSLADESFLIPYIVRTEVQDILIELSKHLKKSDRASFKSEMEAELEEVLEDFTHKNSIIYMFSTVTGNIKLSHFEGMCKDKPMLLILRENDNTFSARASVPESFLDKTKEGNAHNWLFTAFQPLKDSSLLHKDSNQYVKAPPGKDKNLVAHLKAIKFASRNTEINVKHMNRFVECANVFAFDKWP